MKKYSFNSVGYHKKRYAFSSYQHPKQTHSYYFDAELKRVYLARNKRYSFLSTKPHKLYHFESISTRKASYRFEATLKRFVAGTKKKYHFESKKPHRAYSFSAHLKTHKQYHFEVSLMTLENGRTKRYHFVSTKPHKQYHFESKTHKRHSQYHFESTFLPIFDAEIIRPCTVKRRGILEAIVIKATNVAYTHEGLGAAKIDTNSHDVVIDIKDAARVEMNRFDDTSTFNTVDPFENISVKRDLELEAAVNTLDTAKVMKPIFKGEQYATSNVSIVKKVETASTKEVVALKITGAWLESASCEQVVKFTQTKDEAVLADTRSAEDFRMNKRQMSGDAITLEELTEQTKPYHARHLEVMGLKEQKHIHRAEGIENEKVMLQKELPGDCVVEITEMNSRANPKDIEYAEFVNAVLEKPIIESEVVTNEKVVTSKGVAAESVESETMVPKQLIYEGGQLLVSSMEQTEIEARAIDTERATRTEIIAETPFIESVKRAGVESETFNIDKYALNAVMADKQTSQTVKQVEKEGHFKRVDTFERIVINETIVIEIPKVELSAIESEVIRIDPLNHPEDDKKKPMWLHQNRPRWAARYFTQVRR